MIRGEIEKESCGGGGGGKEDGTGWDGGWGVIVQVFGDPRECWFRRGSGVD